MKKIVYFAAVAALFVSGAAQAAESNVSTNQNNSANIKSRLNATVEHVQDAVSLTSAAIGNTVTIDGGQAGYISNYQFFRGDAVAELNGTQNTTPNGARIRTGETALDKYSQCLYVYGEGART